LIEGNSRDNILVISNMVRDLVKRIIRLKHAYLS
jgi:hypothetical protein